MARSRRSPGCLRRCSPLGRRGWRVPRTAHADGQLWVLASVTKTLPPDWRLSVDFAPRWEQDVSDYSRNVMRAQMARRAGRKVASAVGYEFTDSQSSDRHGDEHRIWQQVQVQQRVGSWTLSHRGRLEQRWLRLAPSVVVRTRYQFRARTPDRAKPSLVVAGARRTALHPPRHRPRPGTGLRPPSTRRRHLPRPVVASHRRRRLHVAGHQPPPPPRRPARPLRRLHLLARYWSGSGLAVAGRALCWQNRDLASTVQARPLRSARC